ncbi:MAG: NAD-dependent epimerase/dehydratase family protein [Bacillota bacterium]
MKEMQGRTILVSGCENFFGRMLSQRLIELGADVIVMCGSDSRRITKASLPGYTLVSTDDPDISGMFCGGIEAIIFLNHPLVMSNKMIGRRFPGSHLAELMKMLRLAERTGTYFIYASSGSVYGKHRYLPMDEGHPVEPILIYGAVKLAGEHFCRAKALENGFSFSILRYGDIYGPGVRHIGEPAIFLENAIKNKPIIIRGAGEQVKSFIYVEDAVEATIKVLANKPSNQAINIAGNDYISIWDLASMIRQNYSVKCEIKTAGKNLTDEVECCLDTTKSADLLGFNPKVDLISGLFKSYGWLLNEIIQTQ